MKLLERFRAHLEAILPLPNPSLYPDANMVLAYCRRVLAESGRAWKEDRANNLITLGSERPGRAIVAHTDSVGQVPADIRPGKKGRMTLRKQKITLRAGVYSGEGLRPIGGDDKVGIAIALAIAESRPEYGAIFTSDEEVGGKGADVVTFPRHYLLVECDRRGATDLVTSIGSEIMGEEAEMEALTLLPHRDPAQGMFTDVDTLMSRGLSDHACNLACGYYLPHSKREVVILAHAAQTCLDAIALLRHLPADIPPAQYGWVGGQDDWAPYGGWGKGQGRTLFPLGEIGRSLGFAGEDDSLCWPPGTPCDGCGFGMTGEDPGPGEQDRPVCWYCLDHEDREEWEEWEAQETPVG